MILKGFVPLPCLLAGYQAEKYDVDMKPPLPGEGEVKQYTKT